MFLGPINWSILEMKNDMFVGLVGNQGAGKTQCAQYLKLGYGFAGASFAAPIYDILEKINPYFADEEASFLCYKHAVAELGVQEAKRLIPRVRELLQIIGTELGRDLHGENCWIRILDRKHGKKSRVVIDDVRFLNEVDYIRSRNGCIVHVISDRAPNRNAKHRSEHMDFAAVADYTVTNNGTLAELHRQLDVIMADFGGKAEE